MKQKMTKLLSLALLVAMVLSLCPAAAFATEPSLPVVENKDGGTLTYSNLSPTNAPSTYEINPTELGLSEYHPEFEVTSESPWITVDSNGIVTASHSAIQHKEGSLEAISSHDDKVTVSYSAGEGEGKVTKTFTVSFKVVDNDAAVLNSELKALRDAAAGGNKDGLLSLLKYVAEKYYPLGSLNVLDEVLIKKEGAAKETVMEVLCSASGLSGVTSGGYDTDSLKVNYGTYVGTLVYGKPEECKVESRSDILDETQKQNRIEEEKTRLHDAAGSGTPDKQLEAVLKYMAKNGYDVNTNTDMDTLLLEKKGSVETIKKLLAEELGLSGITACTSESSGLVVRLTEGADTYVGTMVSGNETDTKVVKEAVSAADVTLYVVDSGKTVTLPDGAKTEYQIDITGLNGVSFETEDGSWVNVSAAGKMTPKERSLQFEQNGVKAVEENSETVTVKYGDKSTAINVTVIDEYAKEYNAEVDNIIAAVSGGINRDKLANVLKYIEENYSNDPTVVGRDAVVMGKKGSGQAIQDLLVDVLKACGVATVKPGTVDEHILRIYLTEGSVNYEGSLTFTAPRTSKVEQKDFAVNGSAIIGYGSDAAVLVFPETVNGNAITTLGYASETADNFWGGKVKEITIPASITTIYPSIFNDYTDLQTINVDSGNAAYSAKNGALYSKDGSKLIAIPAGAAAVTLPTGIKTVGANAIPSDRYKSIVLPQGVTTLENYAIPDCNMLFIPDSVTTISTYAFPRGTGMDVIVVTGSAAETFCKSNNIPCHSVTKAEYSSYASKVTPATEYLVAVQPQDRTAAVGAKATFTANILGSHPAMGWQFSADGKTWKDVVDNDTYNIDNEDLIVTVAQDLDGYQFRAVAGEIITDVATLTVAADLGESESLELGDKGYDMSRLAAKVNGAEMCRNGVGVSPNESVKLANGETAIFTTATYKYDSDVHKSYPVGMQVWVLTNKDGTYTMTHLAELDNMLRYSGSSIRLTGNKGIRMITSISEDLKTKLINQGVGGFTLQEYGTCVAWDSALGGAYPVLGNSKSAYAYKRGAADPVFARGGGLVSYTNVLVGFTNAQCKPDMAMRPYAVLADKNGNTYTVYGGTIHRSIGYIALQNKDAFKSGSDAYNYIWDIIHTVYGKDYKG